MHRLKLTKDKFISFLKAVQTITGHLQDQKKGMDYTLERARVNVYLYIMEDLSRKMRSKLIMLESESGNKKLSYTFTGMQLLIIFTYRKIEMDAYTTSVLEQESAKVLPKLLE